jgi:hypothetical protein
MEKGAAAAAAAAATTNQIHLLDFFEMGFLGSYKTFCTLLQSRPRHCFFLSLSSDCLNFLPEETCIILPEKEKKLPGFVHFFAFFSNLSTTLFLPQQEEQQHHHQKIRYILSFFKMTKKNSLPEHILCILLREWLHDLCLSSSSTMIVQLPDTIFLQRVAELFVKQFQKEKKEDESDFIVASHNYLSCFFLHSFAEFPKQTGETFLATFIRLVFLSPDYLREIETFSLHCIYYFGIQLFRDHFHLPIMHASNFTHFFQEQLFFLPIITDFHQEINKPFHAIEKISLSQLHFFCTEWTQKIN